MHLRLLIFGIFAAGALLAGGGPIGSGITPAGAAEVRTLSERVPAGGTVQVKYLLTQPRPISTAGPKVYMGDFSVNGVSASSPLGDAAGVALAQNGYLSIAIVSPNSDYGTNLDYPFLTVAMTIHPSTPTGSTFPLGFADATFQGPTGPVTLTDPKPGTLTIGGSISIHGVVPGGGTWPAGTVIKVEGTGFRLGTKLATKMKISSPVYISPSEMRFTLAEATTLDTQPIQAVNPDGSQVTFYSYLRGVPVATPSRALLQNAEPMFQAQTHGVAIVGPLQPLALGQFVAIAVQNPTPGPVAVTFYVARSGATSTIVLPSCGRLMDDLSSLLGGAGLNAGDIVTITATSSVQILGILGDENAATVSPFFPAF
jgi:hypothetical protein